jgi:hypothetical protein
MRLARDLIRPFGAPTPKEKGEIMHRIQIHASPLEKLSRSD